MSLMGFKFIIIYVHNMVNTYLNANRIISGQLI